MPWLPAGPLPTGAPAAPALSPPWVHFQLWPFPHKLGPGVNTEPEVGLGGKNPQWKEGQTQEVGGSGQPWQLQEYPKGT